MIHKAKHILENSNAYINAVQDAMYTHVATLDAECYRTKEPVKFEDRLQGEYTAIKKGESWGNLFDCAWFHITGKVPPEAQGKKTVLMLDLSGEGCLFDKDGCPIRGITNVSSEFEVRLGSPGKRIVPFTDCANGAEDVDIWIDAGCNDLFGKFQGDGKVINLSICTCNETARGLYYDFVVLKDLLTCLNENDPRYYSILYAIKNAGSQISDRTTEEFEKARAILQVELEKTGGTPSLSFSAVGHAHMDLAWLWPIRETRRKGGRTFATAIKMLEQYPDYVFGASQPQLYQWVKEDYPLLYEKVKQKVKEGRWEVQGGMWVEPDTNIPSGESLVRQFLYGKRFFREEFGTDVKSLWLPDVFGYSAALPQIIKKSGCDFFSTIKLSWSRVNKFPYHTFTWEGLSDSSVLVHMPPEGTYNSAAMPHSVNDAAKNYQEKGLCDRAMMLFGIGDGGGGPGFEHLERLSRMKNLDGINPVKQEKSAEFFDQIANNADKYPKYKGELYVEIHQGTLTTQGKNKKFNRLIEKALHDAELTCTQASIKNADFVYPSEEIETIWKELLLYQFHDILPGSSIKRVYDESVVRYASLLEQTKAVINNALLALSDTDASSFYNQLPWERTTLIERDGIIKALTAAPFDFTSESAANVDINDNFFADDKTLENDLIRVTFDQNGFICSIFDKLNNRESILPGAFANELKVFTDLGGDGWDFAIDYRDKKTERFILKDFVVTKTPLKIVRKNTYCYGNSTLTQDVSLDIGGKFVNFDTKVSWHEKDKMLRSEFKTAIKTEQVSCDIQFGNIKRNTTQNTSFDYAKIEVAAHKWIDMSEPNYGVAMISDCKYGYYAKEGVLSINLLRSPGYPDEAADIGDHEFSYAFYPHSGDTYASDIEKIGYEYNNPMIKTDKKGVVPFIAGVKNGCSVILETIKKSEDNNDVIVRLYENKGVLATAAISIDERFTSCNLTSLIEDNQQQLQIENGAVTLKFSPFEVHTLRLSR